MRIPINWLKDYVELPKSLSVLCDKLTMAGHMLDKIDKRASETIIDLELRGNRADCYSIIGIAREVSALFQKPLNLPPEHAPLKKSEELEGIKINPKSKYVKRIMAVVIKNVKIAHSPKWLAERLVAYSIPPINNIVDLTNYVMLETGEPMHAFDLALVKPAIDIRTAKEGEKIVTFEGTTLNLNKDDLVWARKNAILSVAGAIGAKDYSIQPNTKAILVEAAGYDRVNIRRTCRRLNLNTDAGLRHEKELDPNLVQTAIYRFLYLIKANGWGEISEKCFDYYPNPRTEKTIPLNLDFLQKLGGLFVPAEKVEEMLTGLFFKVETIGDNSLSVTVPTYRTDVDQEEDLVEEVLRVYSYDMIPAQTLALAIPPISTPSYINQERHIKEALVSLGFDEMITLAFVQEKNLALNKPIEDSPGWEPIALTNPPSPDTKVLRTTLLPNLLDATKKVINERGEQARFFEVGKDYGHKEDKYGERRRLGLIFWKKEASKLTEFKGYLEAFFKLVNLPGFAFKEEALSAFTHLQFAMQSNGETFGFGGQIEATIFYAEFDLDTLLPLSQTPKVSLWSKYPPVIEDMSFMVADKTPIGPVIEEIKLLSPSIKSVALLGSYEKTRTFRIEYQNATQNLSDTEIKPIREKIITTLDLKFSAKLKSV